MKAMVRFCWSLFLRGTGDLLGVVSQGRPRGLLPIPALELGTLGTSVCSSKKEGLKTMQLTGSAVRCNYNFAQKIFGKVPSKEQGLSQVSHDKSFIPVPPTQLHQKPLGMLGPVCISFPLLEPSTVPSMQKAINKYLLMDYL